MSEAVIKVNSLNKIYRFGLFYRNSVKAVADMNIEIMSGEIFGLLGPNGSGKTTTLRCILGVIRPTSGAVEIMGQPVKRGGDLFQQIGYLPEEFCLFDHLSGEAILKFYARLYNLEGAECQYQVDHCLEMVGIGTERNRSVRGYSKGMKQKLAMAQALLNNPRILFLDEPSRGLDPLTCKQVRDVIKQLQQCGTTVFINSHQLSEVEKVCTRVGIMKSGQLIAQGTIEAILKAKGTLEDYFIQTVHGEDEKDLGHSH